MYVLPDACDISQYHGSTSRRRTSGSKSPFMWKMPHTLAPFLVTPGNAPKHVDSAFLWCRQSEMIARMLCGACTLQRMYTAAHVQPAHLQHITNTHTVKILPTENSYPFARGRVPYRTFGSTLGMSYSYRFWAEIQKSYSSCHAPTVHCLQAHILSYVAFNGCSSVQYNIRFHSVQCTRTHLHIPKQ